MSTIETLRPAPSSAVAVAPPAHLPTFDISGLYGDARQRAAMADMLRDILHTHGFFYLTGHGADPALLTRTMEMAKRFFALPLEDKQAIDIVHSPQFRGYTRAGGELTRGKPDWREQVDFDREEDLLPVDADAPAWHRTIGPNQWPPALPELRAVITEYQAEATRICIAILKATALALGQTDSIFNEMIMPLPRQHLKILRYPGREQAAGDQGVGAHKDGGLVTLLLQDTVPGLRVQQQDGSWIDAPPIPGTFVINTGELLELATNGFVCADVHAATSPPPGTERFSIAFFLGAHHRASVPFIDLPADLARAARGASSDPDNPLMRDVGANHLKARLRSHPNVAERHYTDL